MSRLVDDLLSLSRIEMKAHVRPDRPRSTWSTSSRHVVDALEPLARDLGVDDRDRPARRPGRRSSGDRDELIQVFENLIENACKYGQTGGRVTVTANIGRRPGRACRHRARLRPRHRRGAPSAPHRAFLSGRCRGKPRNIAAPVSAWRSSNISLPATGSGSHDRQPDGRGRRRSPSLFHRPNSFSPAKKDEENQKGCPVIELSSRCHRTVADRLYGPRRSGAVLQGPSTARSPPQKQGEAR